MKKAFTLIEILIVIAIIGILAVAVLIALDPVEQVARANDTKLVTASGEIRGAMQRFYASHQFSAWCATGSGSACTTYATNCVAGGGNGGFFATAGTCAASILQNLKDAGELKSNVSVDAKLGINYTPATNSFFQYYIPYSKAEASKFATATNPNGTYTDNTCVTYASAGAACFMASPKTCNYCVF